MQHLKKPNLSIEASELIALMSDSVEFVKNSRAKNTRLAYESDFKHFSQWCSSNGLTPLPASVQTIAIYITYLSKSYKNSSIKRKLTSIAVNHKENGHVNPIQETNIKRLWAGLKRTNGFEQTQKKPLLSNHIITIVQSLPDTIKGYRDKAIFLIGFAGAFRRSELVNLKYRDLEFNDAGVMIRIRRSKTDKNSIGYSKAICFTSNPDTCPVKALSKWIGISGINDGYIFRAVTKSGEIKNKLSGHGLVKAIKCYVDKLGFDSAQYSGHSLRAGFATQAAINDVPEFSIKKQGNWNSEIYKSYIRIGNLFKNNASERLGL